MSIRISFKLKGYEKQLALALQRQMSEEGGPINLDRIVERLFTNWMYRNLQSTTNEPSQPKGEKSEESYASAQAPENSQGHSESVAASVSSDASPEPT